MFLVLIERNWQVCAEPRVVKSGIVVAQVALWGAELFTVKTF